MALGEKITMLRQQRNWTQKDLAAAMDESVQEIARWEKGNGDPGMDRLLHLCLIFEIPLEELTGKASRELGMQPGEEIKKLRKDRLLLTVKVLGVLLAVLTGILINMVWLRFLFRFF